MILRFPWKHTNPNDTHQSWFNSTTEGCAKSM
jgi:hypothetical protein